MIKNLPKNRFAAIVALFISLLMPTVAKAQEAYAVEDGTTLTFYYDSQRTNRTGTVYGIDQKREDNNIFPVWAGSYSVKNDRITKAVFDASFKNYLPTSTAYWFLNCSKLETIEGLDNLNTTNVTDMSWMFYNCKALTRLDVSSLNTQNVTKMNYMFSGCSALTTLDLSNFNTAKVTNMSFMLGYCYALTTLDISNFKTEKVTDMSAMFYGCSALTTIYCNYTWTCSSSSEMFNGCTSLKGAVPFDSSKNDVSMANPYTGYFTATNDSEAYAVEYGTTLTFYYDLLRDTRSGTVYTAFDEHQWTGTDITKVVFDATFNYYLPTSTASWFKDCSKLAAIEGLDNLNTRNVTDMGGMFKGCSALTSLDVSNFNTTKVTDMSNMFNGCSALTELDLLNFNTEKVTNMGNMFSGCSALTTINCSRAWTCNESTDMFKGCTSLIGAVAYDASKTDVTMANPFTGYFNCDTEAYAVEDGTTLTFYYDKLRTIRTGTVYDIDQTHSADNNHPVWAGSGWGVYNDKITKVVFDSSFKNYRPLTTESWFYNCRKIATIEGIENLNTENVTHMGGMFWGCESLTELDVTGFNTANVTNMLGTFYGCSALTELDVSGFVTDKVTIMDGMFNRCSKLTTIDVSGFNTENVTDMHNMFLYCSALEWLDLSNFNTEKVTDMHEMFLNCGALKTIYCNDAWTCDNSTKMFSGCTSLKGAVAYDASKLDVSMANPETGYFTTRGETEAYVVEDGTTLTFYYDFISANRTGTVYGIDQKREDDNYHPAWAGDGFSEYNDRITKVVFDASFKDYRPSTTKFWFYRCKSLETIEGIENLNTENVTDMSWMFYNCKALTSLDLSNFNTENVTDMSWMFYNCSALTTIDVSGFNTENVTDMSLMFSYCSALTELDLSNFNTAKVTNMGDMFYNCSSLTSIDVTGFVTDNVTNMDGMFAGCSALTKLDVSNFNTEKVTDMHNMFNGCKALTSLDLSNFNSENVTEMYSMFDGCSALTTIYCNYVWTCDNSTNMFADCTSLVGAVAYDANRTDVTMANPDTGYFTCYKAYAKKNNNVITFFYGNPHNERNGSILHFPDGNGIPEWANNGQITKVVFDASFKKCRPSSTSRWFYNCTALETIEGIENLNTENVIDMSLMFNGCESLTSVDVSGFNTANVTEMYSMFDGCSVLTALDVSGFNTANVTDMGYMFNGCAALASIDVSSLNTERVRFMESMFNGCAALTTLDVTNFATERVRYMDNMFRDCSALTTIKCDNTWTCGTSTDMFKGCTALKGAVEYDESKVDVLMANPKTGYFTGEGTTAISEINADAEGGATVIYNLHGVKMHDDLQSLPAGIYIVNGKKVIVK